MSKVLQLVRRQVELYEEQPEAWKVEYDAACHCHEVEEAIAFGSFVFGRICYVDEAFRSAFFSEKIAYNAELDGQIEELFRLWAVTSGEYLREVEKLEKDGYHVDGAEEFRRCYKEARGIVTDDAAFFAGQALCDLRDDAINAHQRGETVPLGRMSD